MRDSLAFELSEQRRQAHNADVLIALTTARYRRQQRSKWFWRIVPVMALAGMFAAAVYIGGM